jgi:hypothetical protein
MWIVGIVLILGGVGLFYASTRSKASMEAMASTETATAEELSTAAKGVAEEIGPGSFRQLTELKGNVECDNPITSELAKQECVYYHMNVSREWEETYWETDSEGREQRRTRRGSDVMASNTRSQEFVVRDDTGTTVVEPNGATFHAVSAVSRFEPGERSGQLSFGGFSLSISGFGSANRRTLGYRFEESVIPPGHRIYVLGEASDAGGRLSVRKPEEKGKKFIVSVKSEEELMASAATSAKWLRVGAIAAGILGVILVVVGIVT